MVSPIMSVKVVINAHNPIIFAFITFAVALASFAAASPVVLVASPTVTLTVIASTSACPLAMPPCCTYRRRRLFCLQRSCLYPQRRKRHRVLHWQRRRERLDISPQPLAEPLPPPCVAATAVPSVVSAAAGATITAGVNADATFVSSVGDVQKALTAENIASNNISVSVVITTLIWNTSNLPTHLCVRLHATRCSGAYAASETHFTAEVASLAANLNIPTTQITALELAGSALTAQFVGPPLPWPSRGMQGAASFYTSRQGISTANVIASAVANFNATVAALSKIS
ncbi:hypothetical protein C8R43DRAFT_1232850 [Mycena crocata]|nr:hypothetical protein C8R43DRAFT_1232850 [Mycena crocata]